MFENKGEMDGIIIKYNLNGGVELTSCIGGNGNDEFTEIILDKEDIVIAGLSSSDSITASNINNGIFTINRLGDVDTLIIRLDKDLIIESGMNLSGEEGQLVQDIGINQYTRNICIRH